jgi:hypothetical protein
VSEPPRAEALPNTRRRRWRWALLALVLVLTGAIGIGLWRNTRQPLTDEERQLVGTWVIQFDRNPTDVVIEYEYRPDRTWRLWNYRPKSGDFKGQSPALSGTWRLSGNKITKRYRRAAGSIWHPLPSQRSVEDVLILTPDGPDRFRYTGTVERAPGEPPSTGTMTRVPAAE